MFEKQKVSTQVFKKIKSVFYSHEDLNFFPKPYKLNEFDQFVDNKLSFGLLLAWIPLVFFSLHFFFPSISTALDLWYGFAGVIFAAYSGYIFYPRIIKKKRTNISLVLKYCFLSGVYSILPMIQMIQGL